jgi:ketosteroid isomerase-like protein
VIQRRHEFLDGDHDRDRLDALLADDVVFYSSAVSHPRKVAPRPRCTSLQRRSCSARTTFTTWGSGSVRARRCSRFEATVDGVYVDGIDMIAWNEDGKITSFKVMIRPLKGDSNGCHHARRFRPRVLDPRWHFVVALAMHDAVTLEFLEVLGELIQSRVSAGPIRCSCCRSVIVGTPSVRARMPSRVSRFVPVCLAGP